MTAENREECMFLLFEQGHNGKSTFIDTINENMGDYGHVGDDTLLFSSKSKGQNRADEAELRGKRCVSISEPQAGAGLNDSKVKQLLNKTISAMRKYGHPETFEATHKIWLDTNHKPPTSVIDEGFWRRVKLIPFNAHIPYDERVEDYFKILVNEEGSGILNWMLEGVENWQQTPLKKQPHAITQATSEWQQESDAVGRFLADETIDDADARVKRTDLYRAYQEWCKQEGLDKPKTKKNFEQTMKEKGYEPKDFSDMRAWKGLDMLIRSNNDSFNSDNDVVDDEFNFKAV